MLLSFASLSIRISSLNTVLICADFGEGEAEKLPNWVTAGEMGERIRRRSWRDCAAE